LSGRIMQPTLVLFFDLVRMTQQGTDVLPDGVIEAIGMHRTHRAARRLCGIDGMGAATAVVAIAATVVRCATVKGITTVAAHDQPLQQMACAAAALAVSPTILRELF